VIFGQGADDYIQIIGSISIPACIHAGGGNDNVKGGDGADILLGGDGDDLLIGGGGRDLMIGGIGADRLVGNTEEDILIAGTTAYDNNDEALCAIMNEWTSAGSYSLRTTNITNGTGLTSGFRLSSNDGVNQTVFNDTSADTLTAAKASIGFSRIVSPTTAASWTG
jgi:Ca2+-binding RTX toxin-like protein